MVVEILAVGTELLMGQIANTNAQYITSRLQEIGFKVYFHSVVGDNPERLKTSLKLALSRSDVVITTGGLGPTKDDLTKETIAEYFGLKMVVHQESADKIRNFFARLGRDITLNNLKQAEMPEGCIILENKAGTAPGCIVSGDEGSVILLPGPPSEMKPMFDSSVMPWLQKDSESVIISRYVKVFGIGESKLEDMILDIIEGQSNPTVAPYVKDGVVTVRVTAMCNEEPECFEIMEPVIKEIILRTGTAVFSTTGQSMEEVVVELLKANSMKIATAESCTGGLLASRLIDVAGASKVFEQGYITYSDSSKVSELGVDEKTIDMFGAVSEEVALEMARGLFKKAKVGVAVSLTGIAGPGGGTTEKPVGLVYIAFKTTDKEWVVKLNLWGDRTRIRLMSVLTALNEVRKYLIGNY
ncbi:MAG: competence/damage-inducible protein A [Bacillota bacterium]